MANELENRTVFITGGSRGLGRATAIACARAGADIVITGRDRAKLDETTDAIRATGRDALAIECEITDPAQVEAAVERAWATGGVDAAFHYAGINLFQPAIETTDEQLRDVHETNVFGTFYSCRALGRRMLEQGHGKIVNIASDFGIRGDANWSAYAASKAAVIVMSKSLAWEWAPAVTVNCIAPGAFYTDINSDMLDQPEIAAWVKDITPLQRWGTPDEIGPLAVLLASDGSNYMTGGVYRIDGGVVKA